MSNYKTTKGNLVSVDFINYYYSRHDVEDYVGFTNIDGRVYLNIGRDYVEINDTEFTGEEISWILGNDDWKENYEEIEQRQFEINMEEKLKGKTIKYLYVRDYGSGGMSCVESYKGGGCNGFIIYDEEISEEGQKAFYHTFRAYIEGEFYSVSIYSPKEYIANDGDKLIEWIYEDSEQFLISEQEALDSVNTETRGKILKESERPNFSYYERP